MRGVKEKEGISLDQAQQLRNIIKMNNETSRPMARVIAVTSGKGGVGKSNVAINLAIQLRKLGQRVIILDADFGLANIEIMFGTVPEFNLYDLIYQGKDITDIITWGPEGVGFISGGSGITGMSNLSREYLSCIIQSLEKLDSMADVIIVDTGAGISDAVLEFLVASGEVLLVTTPEPTSITDSYSLLKQLNRHSRFSSEMTHIKMIANRVTKDEDGKVLYHKLNTVVTRYLKISMDYLGMVPYDEQLSQAVMQQKPISLQNPGAKSAKAFEQMANILMFGEAAAKIKKRGMAAFFSHIISGKNKN